MSAGVPQAAPAAPSPDAVATTFSVTLVLALPSSNRYGLSRVVRSWPSMASRKEPSFTSTPVSVSGERAASSQFSPGNTCAMR